MYERLAKNPIVAVIIVLAGLATIWTALSKDTIPEAIRKRSVGIAVPSGVTWFPLVIGVSIIVLQVVLIVSVRRTQPPPEGAMSVASLQRATMPPPPPPPEGPDESERIIVDVSPDFLAGLFKNQTDIQGQKVIALYQGKWMTVSGRLSNVRPTGENLAMVSFDTGIGHPSVLMHFRGRKWVDRLSVLMTGMNVTVTGQLREADSRSVVLENCELVVP